MSCSIIVRRKVWSDSMQKEKEEKKRLAYPEMVKGVGMILVIMAHSPYPSTPVRAFITAFHMPLFFIVSGILMCHTGEDRRALKPTLLKKVKSIMIPYVTFSLLYMLINYVTLLVKPENVPENTLFKNFVDFVTLYGISVLWFLTALFFGEVFFICTKKLANKRAHTDSVMVMLGIAAALIVLSVSKAFHAYYPLYRSMPLLFLGDFIMVLLRGIGAMSFLTIGYYLYKWYLSKEIKWGWAEVLAGLVCFMLVYLISAQNGVVDFHFLYFFQPVLYYSGAVLGTLGTVLLCRHLPKSRLLYFFGANSLVIMVTHLDCKVLITAIHYANWLNLYITRAKVYFLYLNVTVMVILLEVVCVVLIRNCFPFLIGKPWPKSAKRK